MQDAEQTPEPKNVEITVEIIADGPPWHAQARKELRANGSWSRMLGGGFVTSSKDPSEWEHPYLK